MEQQVQHDLYQWLLMGAVILGFLGAVWRLVRLQNEHVRTEEKMKNDIDNLKGAYQRNSDRIDEVEAASKETHTALYEKIDRVTEELAKMQGQLGTLITMLTEKFSKPGDA